MTLFIASFLFVLINSVALIQLQKDFVLSGCSKDGLLFPSTLNELAWHRLKNERRALLHFLLNSNHKVSLSLCHGPQSVSGSSAQKSSHTFHASWECYEQNKRCQLPSANVYTLQTARYHHPNAKLIIWSNSLPPKLSSLPEVEIRRYGHSLFQTLPPNARLASESIPLFFEKTPNSHSHFSDLLRVAILYQFGGIWMDLDSLFLGSASQVTQREWLPKTFHDGVDFAIEDENGRRFIIEGGMMKFDAGSSFLLSVLENFPKYDLETAECWACVGPKLLTETYTSTSSTPSLIPSSRLFGNNHYRVTLSQAFLTRGLDLQILQEHINNNAVAVHLFTSSGERAVESGSLIDLFLRSSGVGGTIPKDVYVPLGPLSRRRHLQGNDPDSAQYDFHFCFFQLRLSSPSLDEMKSEENQNTLRDGIAQTVFISADVIDIEVLERDGAVLVDVQAQTNSAKAVDIVNSDTFVSSLNSILGDGIVVEESTQVVDADLTMAALADYDGRPQISISTTTMSPTESPTSNLTLPPTNSPTTKLTTQTTTAKGNKETTEIIATTSSALVESDTGIVADGGEVGGEDNPMDVYIFVLAGVLGFLLCGVCCFLYYCCFMSGKERVRSQSQFEMAYWSDNQDLDYGGGSINSAWASDAHQKRQPEGHHHVQYIAY